MGASASAHSEELLAARARLTDAQLQALDACFAFGDELNSDAFQARVGPGGRLGERLAALLAAQAHLPPALRRATHGVTLEALTIAKATLESGTDEQVAAFGALLLPAPCRVADVAWLVADLVSAVYPDAKEEASAAAAHAIASGVAEPARDGGAANDAHAPQTLLRVDDVASWLQRTPAALRTLRGALAVPQGLPWRPASLDYRGTPQHVSLLNASWAWLIAPLLPPACQQGWTLLFSSLAHGASFSTLFGRSAGRGPVLVLVRDKCAALAAGFADAPLIKRAAFYGGYSCLLMGLLPQARVYQPSGNNEHMVWCADGFESVPNGIGFGGQVNHFGLFVSADMERGHSRFSATFANAPVLGAGDPAGSFELDALEIWGVDADAMAEADELAAKAARRAAGGGSVLDRFAQDRSFLQTALNRGSASEGVR